MNREAVQAFATRVTAASKSELIVILYEMTLTELTEARKAYESGDIAAFEKELKAAHKYVNELLIPLDYHYRVSYDLASLYLFVNKRIITAIIQRKPDTLDSAESILKKLLVGFEGVSRQDDSKPMMRNTQQLYAGLTYGKGTLNETYIDSGYKNRGYIV